MAVKHGHTFWFWLLGNRLFFTSDPENVKVVLSTSFDVFEHGPRRRNAANAVMGNTIFALDGAEWRAARALLRPSFAKSQIHNTSMLEAHLTNLVRVLPCDGTVVDLQETFQCLSMDIITEMLFGKSLESLSSLENREGVEFSRALDYASIVGWRETLIGSLARVIPDPKWWRSVRTIHSFVDRYVQKALDHNSPSSPLTQGAKEKGEGRFIFLESLAERTRDPRILREQVTAAMLGGRDTTSSVLSNLFYMLARNPDVWRSLRAEVKRLSNTPPLTMEDLGQAKYARNCVRESLRLHPAVPVDMRTASIDTTIPCGGQTGAKSSVNIPKGSSIFIPFYTMHRREDIFGADARVFRPERWDDLNVGWGYTPFGGGPRTCIGQEFAMTEIMYIVVRMLQVFEGIEPSDTKPWRENLSVTLNSAEGCKVSLKRA